MQLTSAEKYSALQKESTFYFTFLVNVGPESLSENYLLSFPLLLGWRQVFYQWKASVMADSSLIASKSYDQPCKL